MIRSLIAAFVASPVVAIYTISACIAWTLQPLHMLKLCAWAVFVVICVGTIEARGVEKGRRIERVEMHQAIARIDKQLDAKLYGQALNAIDKLRRGDE